MKVIASWSGGKDSCLAVNRALSQGYKIEYLVNFISEVDKKGAFHKISPELMHFQSRALGIPIFQKEVPRTMEGYERAFKEAVVRLKTEAGIEGMVFGDVGLQEHRDWVDRVCGEIGIQAIEPLWGLKSQDVVYEFIENGFQAVVINLKLDLLEKEWIGRNLDLDFVNHLKLKNIDLCGENGEFHTFVVDGPIFQSRIDVVESKELTIQGDKYNNCYLDILKYKIVEKEQSLTQTLSPEGRGKG